jgi:N utilization substance protein B
MSSAHSTHPSPQRKSRELALQMLFAWDATGERDDNLAVQILNDQTDSQDDWAWRGRAKHLADGAWDARAVSDQWVERLAPQWPPRRQPGVDRNIIRLAIYELTTGQVPPKVAIDEAIELAKIYSTENSPSFVNGVLDAVLREHAALTAAPDVQVPKSESNSNPE